MGMARNSADDKDAAAALRAFLSLPPAARVWVCGHARSTRAVVEQAVGGAERPSLGTVDLAVIVPASSDEAAYFASKILERLAPSASVVVVWRQPSGNAGGAAAGDDLQAWAALPQPGMRTGDRFEAGTLRAVRLHRTQP